MNMPMNEDGKVNFTTTLFALIRENLSIKMRPAEEMDQADKELRETIKKLWPLQAKKVVHKLIPLDEGQCNHLSFTCTLQYHNDFLKLQNSGSKKLPWAKCTPLCLYWKIGRQLDSDKYLVVVWRYDKITLYPIY